MKGARLYFVPLRKLRKAPDCGAGANADDGEGTPPTPGSLALGATG